MAYFFAAIDIFAAHWACSAIVCRGYGRVLGLLHVHGYTNLIGVDPAPAMVAAARERFPGISFQEFVQPPNLALTNESVDATL